jgi:hypothetical protein
MTGKELAVSWFIFYENFFKLTLYWPRAFQSLAHWKNFYAEHPDYVKVGRVNHRQIDPESPIPEHCDPKKAKEAQEEEVKKRKKPERDEL